MSANKYLLTALYIYFDTWYLIYILVVLFSNSNITLNSILIITSKKKYSLHFHFIYILVYLFGTSNIAHIIILDEPIKSIEFCTN